MHINLLFINGSEHIKKINVAENTPHTNIIIIITNTCLYGFDNFEFGEFKLSSKLSF